METNTLYEELGMHELLHYPLRRCRECGGTNEMVHPEVFYDLDENGTPIVGHAVSEAVCRAKLNVKT